VEAEAAGLEDFMRGFLGDFLEFFGAHLGEPFLIKIRLGGDHREGVAGELEDLSGALFGLIVEVLGPLEGGGRLDLDGRELGLGTGAGGLGVEEIAVGLPHVFGEEAPGDVFASGGAGGEEVCPGRAQVSGPSDGLGPRACGEVEGEGGEEFLEGAVEPLGVPFLSLHQVEVVVGKDGSEIRAHEEAVFFAEKD